MRVPWLPPVVTSLTNCTALTEQRSQLQQTREELSGTIESMTFEVKVLRVQLKRSHEEIMEQQAEGNQPRYTVGLVTTGNVYR